MNYNLILQKKSVLISALFFAASVSIVLLLNNLNLTLDMHKVVPSVSAGSFLNGLRLARSAYKRTKNFRKAMKLVSSWSIVSLLISVGGDWLIGMLINGNLSVLANW